MLTFVRWPWFRCYVSVALELENGLERERGGLLSSEPQLPAGLSPGVREYLRCTLSGRRTEGSHNEIRRCEDAAGGLSLILPRNRPRSRRGILTNGKRAMARVQGREEKEKETKKHRRAASKSCFEVWVLLLSCESPQADVFSFFFLAFLKIYFYVNIE